MGIQYRSEDDPRSFSPDRDIAHQGPYLLARAVESFQDRWREPWFRELLEKDAVTEAEVAEGLEKFKAVANQVIETYDPAAAIANTGFDKIKPALQAAIYVRLGQVFLAAYYTGVKESRLQGDSAPPEVTSIEAAKLAKHFAVGKRNVLTRLLARLGL